MYGGYPETGGTKSQPREHSTQDVDERGGWSLCTECPEFGDHVHRAESRCRAGEFVGVVVVDEAELAPRTSVVGVVSAGTSSHRPSKPSSPLRKES